MRKQNDTLHFAVLAVDTALFRIHEGVLEVLLIPVIIPEFKGKLGFPGGLIDPHETAHDSSKRHLKIKTGISDCYTEQLYTFSSLNRDPRGRVVSVAYIGLIQDNKSSNIVKGATWVPARKKHALAYDHEDILNVAIERLKNKLAYTTVIRYLLPNEFTLTMLQEAYELILRQKFDKRNFRKKILALHILKDTKRVLGGEANRPAALYTWAKADSGIIEIL